MGRIPDIARARERAVVADPPRHHRQIAAWHQYREQTVQLGSWMMQVLDDLAGGDEVVALVPDCRVRRIEHVVEMDTQPRLRQHWPERRSGPRAEVEADRAARDSGDERVGQTSQELAVARVCRVVPVLVVPRLLGRGIHTRRRRHEDQRAVAAPPVAPYPVPVIWRRVARATERTRGRRFKPAPRRLLRQVFHVYGDRVV